MEAIYANTSVSVTELKRNPSAVIDAAEGAPVAILNHNKPAAYLIPAKAFEALMDRLEDIELAEIVRERRGQKRVRVKLENL